MSIFSALGGMSAAQARKQKDQAARERRWAEQERYKKSQAERRARERHARAERKRRLELARELCRENSRAAREVARDTYRREQEILRAKRKRTTSEAARGCKSGKSEVRRQAQETIDASKRLREEERRARAELRRIEATSRKREAARAKASKREKKSESDDAVLANIAPEHRALFKKVKGQIRATDRKSRTEAFEQYLHENPGEAIRARETAAERAWKREVSARYREERAQRRAS